MAGHAWAWMGIAGHDWARMRMNEAEGAQISTVDTSQCSPQALLHRFPPLLTHRTDQCEEREELNQICASLFTSDRNVIGWPQAILITSHLSFTCLFWNTVSRIQFLLSSREAQFLGKALCYVADTDIITTACQELLNYQEPVLYLKYI